VSSLSPVRDVKNQSVLPPPNRATSLFDLTQLRRFGAASRLIVARLAGRGGSPYASTVGRRCEPLPTRRRGARELPNGL
jgi:hypothetical protein